MNIYTGAGWAVLMLTNDHCDPHVHVEPKNQEWYARFKFSFWHSGVNLWDVTPEKNSPTKKILEKIRVAIEDPACLRKARESWWNIQKKTCVENKFWDSVNLSICESAGQSTVFQIEKSSFDVSDYSTTLIIRGSNDVIKIEL